MKIHEGVIQGSKEWHALRAKHYCASEAPVMMGESKYMTRDALIKQYATGVSEEFGPDIQKLFDKGHVAEASIRPYIEEFTGVDLYPITGTTEVDGLPLLASYDGLSMDYAINFEHKLYNKTIVADIEAGREIHPTYIWQMEHQVLVCKEEGMLSETESLFVTSDGTKDKMKYLWYKSSPERQAALIAGWKQFKKDVENYKHTAEAPTATATPTLDLPAVYIKVDGSIALQSNLEVFGLKLKEFVGGIDMKPEDDQGFANAEAAVKTLEKAQKALETAESAALAQTATIDEMRRTVALYVELARSTRLALDKVVKTQKDAVRAKLVREANDAMFSHLETVNKGLGGNYIGAHAANFPSVIKGKKTITSIKSALNDEVARAKIVANESAEKIRENIQVIDAAKEYKFLFNDLHQIITKEPSDFLLLVDDRVGKHKVAEAEKLERERERIRIEEKAKATVAVTTETTQQTVPIMPEPKKTATGKVKKPTKDEVITVLSSHYRVDKATVNGWLASWTFK